MNKGYGFGGEEVREESSWRYPLGIFVATLLLCAVFLYYYVGPSVDELGGNTPSPAISEEPIEYAVGELKFRTPTNYTIFPRDRRGGDRDEVALYALWPTLTGYTPARRDEFVENPKNTRRIDILISDRTSAFTEQERIDVLYLPQTNDRRGARTSYDLLKFTFKDARANVPTNGYAETELYLGESADGGRLALFCFEDREDVRNPECWREFEISPSVTVSYRYKRRLLDEWKAIDSRVRALVEGMIVKD
jgi:hypothetical protein